MEKNDLHTREALMQMHTELSCSSRALMMKKNQDYSVGENPYSNFLAGEAVTGVRAELLLIGRWADKLTRLSSLITKGYAAVENESADDAIEDSMNYPVLLKGLMKYKASLKDEEGFKYSHNHKQLHDFISGRIRDLEHRAQKSTNGSVAQKKYFAQAAELEGINLIMKSFDRAVIEEAL